MGINPQAVEWLNWQLNMFAGLNAVATKEDKLKEFKSKLTELITCVAKLDDMQMAKQLHDELIELFVGK